MILLDLHVLLFMYLSISTAVSQWYGLRHGSHFTPIRCTARCVYSLLQCAALGRESKDVRFFFNIENKYCRWNCTYIYRKQTHDKEWNHYGVDEKRNAALFRPCSASSVFNNFHHFWGTTFATDGVYLIFETTQVYASGYENAPWLTVILEGPLVISYVRVFNRLDRDGQRFHDVAFEVSNDGVSFKQRGFFKGPGMTEQVMEILFDYPTIGQYVRLQITQGSSNILNLVEIEIYTTY